eukprot:TRINITY_DN11620_c0_g1_i1.p1 TRINITY_DN11620_c0_g1~~TRINITY_DN11620_c0_g1_i1.p1  ORF type:complete len:461 (-),score=85.02 TRINITY_DN11620_c0_g1_i1:128-1510(-)
MENSAAVGQGKEVLVLGAGLVVRPLVDYLSHKGYKVVLGSRTLDKAEKVVHNCPGAVAVECDVETEQGKATLEKLLPSSHAVVSMLPYLLHPYLAGRALAHNKHFLTTSYVSDAMRALEAEAKERGLVVINECGVDPGTDHMSAMRVIDAVRAKGGRLLGFSSYCGGLPAPEANDNPLGYKLSWSPRGVLLASRNDALFLKDGQQTSIPGKFLFCNPGKNFIQELNTELETYPNRNSLGYIELYGLTGVTDMVRGTFRNKGWCATVRSMVSLGLLDLTERDLNGTTYAGLLRSLINSQATDAAALKADVSKFLQLPEDEQFVLKSFEWLGFFDEAPIPTGTKTPLDAVCKSMEDRMQYKEGERDMLVMRHLFSVEFPADQEGGAPQRKTLSSTLIDYGIPHGDSSMSRTVSLPVAIAVRLVLEGHYTKPGLSIPSIKELYEPILNELATMNIIFKEEEVH